MKKSLQTLLLLLLPSLVLAHGEDKPGPNGGFIRMPSAFHTEVVLSDTDDSFHLYLLDMNFQNPTVKDSQVKAVYEVKGSKPVNFKCEVMGGNHYHCLPDGKYSKSKGKLALTVKREQFEGKAEYVFPLKWAEGAKTNKKSDHSHH